MGTTPLRLVKETQSTSSRVQWSVWRAIEGAIYSPWCFFCFFLFWMEVDNMMSFLVKDFCFSLWGFYQSVFKRSTQNPFTFRPGKCCQFCFEHFLESPPLPRQASLFSLAQKDVYLWHLPTGFKPFQPCMGLEHTKPHCPPRTLGSPGFISMIFLPLTCAFVKLHLKNQISFHWRQLCHLWFSWSENLYLKMRTKGNFSPDIKGRRGRVNMPRIAAKF